MPVGFFPFCKKIRRKIRFSLRLYKSSFSLLFRLLSPPPPTSLLFCIDSPGSVGGTEFFLNKLAEQSAQLHNKPWILITGKLTSRRRHLFLERLQQHSIPFFFLGPIPLASNRWIQKFFLLFFKKTNALSCHFFNPLATGLIPIAKKANMEIVYLETGLPKSQDPWWSPLFPHIELIDEVRAVSYASLHCFFSLFPYRGKNCVVYPLIDPPPSLVRPSRKDRPFFSLLYFGRIDKNKGVHLLLQAFEMLVSEFPSAQLTFLGEGPEKIPLQEQVRKKRIENVRFQGFVKKSHLWETLGRFDLFCLPSFSEGSPCSILEAMSIGLTIVATKVGGIPELIEDRISGLLVEPNDLPALLEALRLCAHSAPLCHELGIQAQNRYQSRFAIS